MGETERDGQVQRGAEEEESAEPREEEKNSRRPGQWEAQAQGATRLHLWQAQAQALEKMASGTTRPDPTPPHPF